jgi:spoIIIJ-associated protein
MDEWVEVKAPTVEEAVKYGMEALEIDNQEHVDVEVITEPEKGFLGIGRQEAVVKLKPRPKPKRKRSRNRRGKGEQSEDGGRGSESGGPRSGQRDNRGSEDLSQGGNRSGQSRGRSGGGQDGPRDRSNSRDGQPRGGQSRSDQSGDGRQGGNRGSGGQGSQRDRGGNASSRPQRGRDNDRGRRDRNEGSSRSTEGDTVDINEQASVIEEFLRGLLGAFGLDGTVETRVEDDVIYADINGEQAGALVGHKATILQAIHELAKTVVQRKTMAGTRLRLDIGGYAERRREALTIYAGRLAKQVIDEAAEIMLEAMNPADRKTVHDAVSEIEGVRSFSEGEDPRRSVVLAPDD